MKLIIPLKDLLHNAHLELPEYLPLKLYKPIIQKLREGKYNIIIIK